jgi:ornithine cyclodeaminase
VGADTQGKRGLPAGLLERARVWADDLAQARRLGELQWTQGSPADELGALLAARDAGTALSPRAPDDITIFDMTGIALQDLTTVRMLYERAFANNIGLDIPWPW